jgi:hypothetical protein
MSIDIILILAAGTCAVFALVADNAKFTAVGVLLLAVSLVV